MIGSGILATGVEWDKTISEINELISQIPAKNLVAQRSLCPKGFVPKEGFGNQRTCKKCDRPLEAHAVVAQ